MSSADLEYAVRQLVEVAVRALSPGINDPNTAISVLDRLGVGAVRPGAALPAERRLSAQRIDRALVVPTIDYDGLVDAMFHMIRQNAAGKRGRPDPDARSPDRGGRVVNAMRHG